MTCKVKSSYYLALYRGVCWALTLSFYRRVMCAILIWTPRAYGRMLVLQPGLGKSCGLLSATTLPGHKGSLGRSPPSPSDEVLEAYPNSRGVMSCFPGGFSHFNVGTDMHQALCYVLCMLYLIEHSFICSTNTNQVPTMDQAHFSRHWKCSWEQTRQNVICYHWVYFPCWSEVGILKQ